MTTTQAPAHPARRAGPVTQVYAGQLWWPASAAAPVLQAWRQLTEGDLPDEFTSAVRLANFPQIPAIPEHLRGRSFAIVFTSHLGRPAEADALLARLRTLRPVTDTIATIPITALGSLHMDPEQPTGGVSRGLMVASLPAEATETFLGVAGPEATRCLSRPSCSASVASSSAPGRAAARWPRSTPTTS
jgi:hypothetical protein